MSEAVIARKGVSSKHTCRLYSFQRIGGRTTMAISVLILEFFRTGAFGPLHLKMTRRQIEEIVGPPDDYGVRSAKEGGRHRKEEDHWKDSSVWFYGDHARGGNVELFFDDGHCLHAIHIDYLFESIASGGKKIEIDPWILHPGLSLEDAQTALTQSQLSYHIRPDPFQEEGLNEGTVHLVLETGVLLYFDVEAEEESRPTGIQLLDFPDTLKHFYDETGNVLPRKRPKGGVKTGRQM